MAVALRAMGSHPWLAIRANTVSTSHFLFVSLIPGAISNDERLTEIPQLPWGTSINPGCPASATELNR